MVVHASNWNLADFKFFSKFINLRARLNIEEEVRKRHVRLHETVQNGGGWMYPKQQHPLCRLGCVFGHLRVANYGMGKSEVLPRLSLFREEKLLARVTLKNCEN